MKIKVKHKNNLLYVSVKLPSSKIIDNEELDLICRVFVRGFLKPSIYKNKIVEYKGTDGISLKKFLKKPLSKYEFLFVIHQIVIAAFNVGRSNLHLSRLWLNVNTVFINEITKELQFIYLPVDHLSDNSDIMTFINQIAFMTNTNSGQSDTDFVSRFMYFLSSLTSFDGMKIERYIEQEDNKITRTHSSVDIPDSSEKTDILYHDPAESGDVTMLLTDETVAFVNEETELIHYPTLKRVSTAETIVLDKSTFRLGKDKRCVEYVITDNNTVSGSHADIITRKGHCYVMDLNSKNKTYINNRVLPSQYEVEILDGDILKLSNEEFIFNI